MFGVFSSIVHRVWVAKRVVLVVDEKIDAIIFVLHVKDLIGPFVLR